MRIYLDHNATTPLRPEVLDAMLPFLSERYGNASSVHAWGACARDAIEEARRAIAATIDARPSEIVFTSGGTESNNLAIIGATEALEAPVLCVAAIEHSSVLLAAAAMHRRGIGLAYIPVDQKGRIDPGALEDLGIAPGGLVSVGLANNEVGTVQAIDCIADFCSRRKAYLHVDAVQAFGKIPVRVDGIHLLSLSAHKIGGPQGVGVLYVRDGVPVQARQIGGPQERGRRAGTENVAGIVGMARACTLALSELSWFGEGCVVLRDRLWEGLRRTIGGVHRHGCSSGLPNTLNVRFDGVDGETLVAALDLAGVGVSSGSACAAGAGEPSHVLLAMGLDERSARNGVRFSLGRDTTVEQIDEVIRLTAAAVERIRSANERRHA